MLQIDKVQEIDGVAVYGDHELFNVFYPIPQQPQYRRDAKGRPLFSFYKYRFPVDHPDGRKGGAFLLFDVEFVVDAAVLEDIKTKLAAQVTAEANRRGISPVPEVVIGTVTYTKGSTSLHYNTGLVDKEVPNGAPPSLFGNNICTFALELPPEGATFFEQAMQGQGGAVSVVYDLWFWARLPQVHITAAFNASTFYSFYQTIDVDWTLWFQTGYRETLREQMNQSESWTLKFDWGGVTDPKVQASLRDWATRSLEDAVERKMIKAVAPVPDDQRKAPKNIQDATKDISNTQISSFTLDYVESQTVEWHHVPQGILPNITSLKDSDGNPIKWSDYARTIDLDDPFFQTLRVNASVNADFKGLPIHSVEVKLDYKGRPMANLAEGEPDGEVVLRSDADVAKFAAFVQGGDWNYSYSYQINYRGESRQYRSPVIQTNEGNLTIGVDDVGILDVDVAAGDIKWDEVERAAVTFTYADIEHGVEPIEEQFALTKDAPSYTIQRVIFQPLRNNYRYQVTYGMRNGRELRGPLIEGRSRKLFINDVFTSRKTVSVRGVGDFTRKIQTVFVDLDWEEKANGYEQTKSQALSAQSTFFDWTFPVINDTGGRLSYKATTNYQDGPPDQLPLTVATTSTILLPPPPVAFLEVQVQSDLVDWTTVRLARVSLSYSDPEGGVSQAKDLILTPKDHAPVTWRVDLKDKSKDAYTYTVTFYLVPRLQKTVGPVTTRDRALILDPDQ